MRIYSSVLRLRRRNRNRKRWKRLWMRRNDFDNFRYCLDFRHMRDFEYMRRLRWRLRQISGEERLNSTLPHTGSGRVVKSALTVTRNLQ